MEDLIRRVRDHLEVAKSYTAHEIELIPILPNEKMHRERRAQAVHAFAKENGWSALILDPSVRVTFSKLGST
ncbi:MAG: hypothetical protein ABI925_03955 [Verrucomicrobiota bacterium]